MSFLWCSIFYDFLMIFIRFCYVLNDFPNFLLIFLIDFDKCLYDFFKCSYDVLMICFMFWFSYDCLMIVLNLLMIFLWFSYDCLHFLMMFLWFAYDFLNFFYDFPNLLHVLHFIMIFLWFLMILMFFFWFYSFYYQFLMIV